MNIENIFKIAIEQNASDVHLVSGLSPILRIDGNLFSIDKFHDLSQYKPAKEDLNNSHELAVDIPGIQVLHDDYSESDSDIYEEIDPSIERYVLSSTDELLSSNPSDGSRMSIFSKERYNLSVVNNIEMFKAIKHFLSKEQIDKLNKDKDLDFSYQFEKYRFRSNISFERGSLKMTSRIISDLMPTMESLDMPQQIYRLLNISQGLVLFTGPTGCGKSTSLAAMINHINHNRSCNIVTLEDPIEFIFQPQKSIISQRQLGTDMPSFASGLRHVLRQDPDVIMVGEMRDLETISTAITLAETGHLVFATLHTCSASQTVDRIIDVFPPHQQNQIKAQLSLVLTAVISQVLVPREGGGRVAVRELLLNNTAVANLIREQKISQIRSVIETHFGEGMISFERSVKDLYNRRLISSETAQTLLNNKLLNN